MSIVGFIEPLFFFSANQCNFVIQTAIGKSIVSMPHNLPLTFCKNVVQFSLRQPECTVVPRCIATLSMQSQPNEAPNVGRYPM